MSIEQGVVKMLRRHQREGRTFLSMGDVLTYISTHNLDSGQKTNIHEDSRLASALENVEIVLYNFGCRPTEGGYILPPRKTAH